MPLVSLALVLACARPAAETPAPAASGPVIAQLDPTSGPPGTTITIIGRGFADTGNVVRFGEIRVSGVPSTLGGTRIVFSSPTEAPSSGEVPPRPVTVGVYDVTITTPAGTSTPVQFTVTSPWGN
jgi:hypothetical protein